METRICFHCKENKELDQYYRSSLAKQDYTCKSCQKKFNKKWLNSKKDISDYNYMFSYLKSRAKTNKIGFILTKEEFISVVKNPCYYCGCILKGISGGLDRIDNNKSIGYKIGNILPCCASCNRIRGDNLTVEETKAAMETVLALRKSKVKA